jgi:hypothetical protein
VGVKHRVSADPADIRLPTAERLTNGAYLYADKNPDSLGRMALALNDVFNWMRPTLIHDLKFANFSTWATSSASSQKMAHYKVPAWVSGIGGVGERARMQAKIMARASAASVSGSWTVQVGGDFFTSGPVSFISTAWGEYYIDIEVDDGVPVLDVILSLTSNGTNTVAIREFRLDWTPRTDHLLSGPYGGRQPNDFLPNDVESLLTPYTAGSVERVRRMLVDAYELLKRRTPQMIVTWSNFSEPVIMSSSIPPAGIPPVVEVRIGTYQPPLVDQCEVYLNYLADADCIIQIGPYEARLPATGPTGQWGNVRIPVPPANFSGTQYRDFRVIRTSTDLALRMMCAWWRRP